MTAALRAELRPLFYVLPGRKLQDVAERLAMLASNDGTVRYGARDSKVMTAAGCSPKTVQRARRYLEAMGVLHTDPGTGRTVTQYRWDLPAARALTAQGGQEGGQQMGDPQGLSPRWAGRAPRGPATWWDRKRMGELVKAVQALRPAWNPAGIIAAAVRALRNGAALPRLREALLAVARAGDSRTPMRVAADGWWWDTKDRRHTNPPGYERAATPTPARGRGEVKPVQRRATHQPGTTELRPGGGRVHGLSQPVTVGETSGWRDMPAWVRDLAEQSRRESAGRYAR